MRSKNTPAGRQNSSTRSGKNADVSKRQSKPSKILSPEEVQIKKEKARWYNIKRLYGLSQAEYEELLEEQDHRCGICKRHEDEFETRLAVDHDHKSLEVRGLLCSYCNRRILGRISNPDLLRMAADYLERPRRGWLAPKKKRNRKRKKKLIE